MAVPPLIQAFRDFALKITPTCAELEPIQARANGIEQAIRDIVSNANLHEFMGRYAGNPQFGPVPLRYVGTHPFGSSQRGTLIKPIEYIDIDLLIAFEGPPSAMVHFDDGQNFLRAVRDILSGLPATSTLYEGECIRLDFGVPPLIDVFPCIDWFSTRSAFAFPHGRSNTWYRSNPVLFDKWVLERNNELEKRFTLMLRMLKSWNWHRKVGLPSFHLEGLAGREFQELHGYWPLEISTFLEAGARRGADFLKMPSHDGFVEDISFGLSVSQKDQIMEEFTRSFETMQEGIEAAKRKDLETTVNAFKSVLGEAFPDWNSLVTTHGY